MKLLPTPLSGLLEIHLDRFTDKRGSFIKLWAKEKWKKEGLPDDWNEIFITKSHHQVLRGMHYQEPPFDHDKMVMAIDGEILDVALDIRKTSSTYGKYFSIKLSGTEPKALFLPKGMAHGFLVLSPLATVLYQTTTPHCAEMDKGILWNSFGFPWPVSSPILSQRDQTLVPFQFLSSAFL